MSQPSPASSWPLAFRLAYRDLAGGATAGLHGFRVMAMCLTLGVATIAAIASITEAVRQGIQADARTLLGGDVDLRLMHRKASRAQLDYLNTQGVVSVVARMRTMARPANRPGVGRILVELKAVDERHPLVGSLDLAPDLPPTRALATKPAGRDRVFGAVVERNLLSRLGLKIGARIAIGAATLEIRAVLKSEPDRASGAFKLGPRVIVSTEALAATGLVLPGSLVRYHYRIKLPLGTHVGAWVEGLAARFPDAGWRVRTTDNPSPGLRRQIDRLGLFLTLVGLTALLIGGIGVGNAVKNHLDAKTSTIAVLKCLGATTAMVFRIYLIEVMAVAVLSIAMGLALGAAVPVVVIGLTADILPGALASAAGTTGPHIQPLALAASYGLLTALAFALWPLAKVRDVPAAQLFRSLVVPLKPWPPVRFTLAVVAAVAGLVALAYLSAPRPTLVLWFILATVAVLVLLQGAAFGLGRAARATGAKTAGRNWPLFHLACANLHRPGSPAGLIVLSLGVGLTVVTTVVQIEGNLRGQIRETVPARAPSFYFIDIQPDQAKAFDQLVAAVPGTGEVRRMPSLRARITHINGTSVRDAAVAPGARWAVRGDRGLSYARHPPPHTRVVAGTWWPPDYTGKPLISLGRHVARGFGVGVGDTLTFNILGREVTATIANLRNIDWASLAMNFTIVFAPGTLEAAPQTHIATVKAATDAEDALQRAVTARFANVTAIRVKDALDAAARVLTGIATATAIVTAVVLVAGILVLGGAIAAGHQRRIYDAAILKVLGARRRQMFAVFAIEYAAIGLITALVATVAGSAAAYAVLTHVMHSSWTPLPTTLTLTIFISMVVILFSGFAGTWRALGEKTAPVLRRHHSMRGN